MAGLRGVGARRRATASVTPTRLGERVRPAPAPQLVEQPADGGCAVLGRDHEPSVAHIVYLTSRQYEEWARQVPSIRVRGQSCRISMRPSSSASQAGVGGRLAGSGAMAHEMRSVSSSGTCGATTGLARLLRTRTITDAGDSPTYARKAARPAASSYSVEARP